MIKALPVLAVSLLLISCGPFWRSPEYFTVREPVELSEPVLTADQYSERAPSHARPYIVSLSGSVVLFGAEHTRDPGNQQFDSITMYWKQLKPTVALVEGRLGFLFRWVSDPVEKFGESGFVFDLAKHDGIRCYTWEPRFEDEIEWTLRIFSQKRTALFYILRPYFGQVKFQRPGDPDGMVEGTIRRRTAVKGLEGSIRDVAEIDSIWRADFGAYKDWRDTDDRFGWPGYLNDVARISNAFRDEHFARVIVRLVKDGERVFAVCGSSHAVKLEQALRSTLKNANK